MAKKRGWQPAVYGKHMVEKLPDNWGALRVAVIERDRFTCQRCDKKFRPIKLTVHHMIPRSEGGIDDICNLVALCSPCHDYVEIHDLRTLADIQGSYDEPMKPQRGRPKSKKKDNEPEKKRAESFDRPDWHAIVYGGMRKRKTYITKYYEK